LKTRSNPGKRSRQPRAPPVEADGSLLSRLRPRAPEVPPQSDETPTMARLGQDALIGERPRSRHRSQSDFRCPESEPDQAGAAVGPGRRVVRVDEPGERNPVLFLGGGQRVGVADQARLEVTLLEALPKSASRSGRTPFSGTARRPWRMTSVSRLRLSAGIPVAPKSLSRHQAESVRHHPL